MALKRRACPCATAVPQGFERGEPRWGDKKNSFMMGFSRNYDGLFYKTSGRKNQTMEPLRTLLLGKDKDILLCTSICWHCVRKVHILPICQWF
jgi:hypothetical protein